MLSKEKKLLQQILSTDMHGAKYALKLHWLYWKNMKNVLINEEMSGEME